ncbi:Uncharacterised protein [Segatella copri]|nr:Uncharacterised protein [Segatella copri]
MVIHEYNRLATQNRIQVKLKWSPISQMLVFHSMIGSKVLKSFIHRNFSPRSWMALGTKLNIATQTGI